MDLKDLAKKYDEMLKIAIYLGADPQTAQDVVQDTFVKLGKIQAKDGNIDRICYNGIINMAYVYNTIRSIYYNLIKRSRKFSERETLPDVVILPEVDTFENHVRDCIRATKSHWYAKKITEIYILQDYSLRELNKETKISLTNIYHTIKEEKSKLKQLIIKE